MKPHEYPYDATWTELANTLRVAEHLLKLAQTQRVYRGTGVSVDVKRAEEEVRKAQDALMAREELISQPGFLIQVNGGSSAFRHHSRTMSTSVTRNVLRNRTLEGPTPSERVILENAVSEIRVLPDGHTAVRQGEPIAVSTLLVEGFMTRHVDAPDGRRHLVAIHVPGDFVDLHAYALKRLDHDVGTLGQATVAIVPHSELDKIEAQHRLLTKRLWFLTVLDAALHRQWVYRVASLSAIERVAHFLCEMHARLLAIGQVSSGAFELPMTQVDIGEVCSLTNVHVNRVVRQLRETGLCDVRSGRVEIFDLKRLAVLGQFQPDYLYLDDLTAAMAGGKPGRSTHGQAASDPQAL